MIYSVSLLMTVADCQALIGLANKEKQTLEYRKTGLELQRLSATTTSQDIEVALMSVTLELQTLQSIYDVLPEGTYKQETFNKIKKAEYRKYLLEQRKENYGVFALLEKECDIAIIDRSIAETNDFIAQVTARMNAI